MICVISMSSLIFAIIRITMNIWQTVLILPQKFAAMTICFSAATKRKPLIINSLEIMAMTIHAGIRFNSTRQIKAEQTRSLSARGSINFPKSVTRLYFLAILPSNISVRDATTKIISAIHLEKSDSIKKTKNGIRKIRKIVNRFGRFMPLPLFQSSHIPSPQ